MGTKADGSGKRVAAHTLGCKVNQYDTEAVLSNFRDHGYRIVDFDEPADVYIINTCTVTNLGDKKSRQLIRRATRANPASVVVAMGCYAQVSPGELAAISGLDLVVGTQRRGEIVQLVEAALLSRSPKSGAEARVVVDPLTRETPFEDCFGTTLVERSRATVKIQEGCAQFCSYCKVPYARGPERSRDPGRVLEEVQRLVSAGIKEIVLTGIHLGSYGRDLGRVDLVGIAEQVAEVSGVYRVRLSSIEPNDVTPRLIELVAGHGKLCRHFHVPLQSGCDTVLARMRRRYDREGYAEVVKAIRRAIPEAALSTDVIVGFPGENEDEFSETVAFVREMAFSRLHVFPYSRRSGTPAAEFPGQLTQTVKSSRVARLIEVGEQLACDYHRTLLGRVVEVLFEEPDAHGWAGLTDTYVRVIAQADRDVVGSVGRVSIRAANLMAVRGDLLDIL